MHPVEMHEIERHPIVVVLDTVHLVLTFISQTKWCVGIDSECVRFGVPLEFTR